jgi:hypothetical protein
VGPGCLADPQACLVALEDALTLAAEEVAARALFLVGLLNMGS